MTHKYIFLAVLLSLSLSSVFAQNTQTTQAASAGNATASKTPAADDKSDSKLPRQYRSLSLGMSLDELKDALTKEALFQFRGDRDVSFLPIRDQSLVETTGMTFIKRAFFQLRDAKVFIMAFTLNTEIIDHYSMFTQFVKKYGQPSYLDPSIAVWETDDTRVAIERPLTVKYIDRTVFNELVNESGLIESGHVQLKQDFLDEF
jgi:hypothetical protein